MSIRYPARRVVHVHAQIVSPGFISRSLFRSGLRPVRFGSSDSASGFAGAWDLPFFVMYAQLIGSSPTRKWLFRQSSFCGTPVLALSDRLSIVRFAHHLRVAAAEAVELRRPSRARRTAAP